MKRFFVRAVAAVMIAMFLSAPCALADLQRGDSGGEVFDLQQLLFETGWLFELPNGVFEKNTEAGVKGFEEYAKLPVDGIADDQMIYELALSLEALNRELGIVSDYFGEYVSEYFAAAPDVEYAGENEQGDAEYAEYCYQWTSVDGNSHINYCRRHHTLHADTIGLLEGNDPELSKSAYEAWYAEINDLYERWAMLLPQEQGAILGKRATFLAAVETQRVANQYGSRTGAQIVKSDAAVCQTLRNQAAWLCCQIWELQAGGDVSVPSVASSEAITLNPSVIIDGQMIYYAGNIEGEGHGVYAMYSDGSDRIRLSDIRASLTAASNGNLLLWHYDDNGYGALEVLRADGRLSKVGYGNSHAIARNGRFYFGGSSVAEDGTDHQWILSSDPEYHDNYYPLEVADGYLYYLDANGGAVGYTSGDVFPEGYVTLNRLDLESGKIELLSGVGTRYLGIEDGMLYYTREDFEIYDYESESVYSVDVDDGLYSMNLEVLAETQIAELNEEPQVVERYICIHDEVVYGEWDCYSDEIACRVLRRNVNGNEMSPIELGEESAVILCVADGVLYSVQVQSTEIDHYYTYAEYLVMHDLLRGTQTRLAMEENEAMICMELRPKIAVNDGRVYYYVQDMDNGTEILKSASLNGDDVVTLLKSAPMF